MYALRLTLLFGALNLIAPAGGPLRVMRVFPAGPADARSEITVTFDRPVAGGLDATVEADRIFGIRPAVAGKVEWRDPVTLRFKPAAPLTPGVQYTVTIAATFSALDGSRLEAPYTFSFRVRAAAVLAADPIGGNESALYVTRQPTLRLLVNAPTDPRFFATHSYITMGPECRGTRVNLILLRVRRLTEQDPSSLRYRGSYRSVRDTAADLRRVIELRPETALPLNCSGTLSVPQEADSTAKLFTWPFRTYGPLQLTSAVCATGKDCPTGPIEIHFTTPVRGADVVRHVRIAPALRYEVDDITAESDIWTLDVRLQPRQHYAVVVDSLMTDVFGQRIGSVAVRAFATTSYAPTLTYGSGKILIERHGFRTLPVQLVNVDSLDVIAVAVPESAEVKFMANAWNWGDPFNELASLATRRRIGFKPELDQPFFAGIDFPANDARVTRNGTLIAARINRPGETAEESRYRGIVLLQVTDLAVHGRIGLDEGMVWVTGVRDGKPRGGAAVTLYDVTGKVRATARTDGQGLARLTNFRPAGEPVCEDWCGGVEGYLGVTLKDDRAVLGISSYDPDLSPWQFGIWGAWSDSERRQAAAAVFTERGIYRPGERVYAKTIVRQGALGALTAPVRGDSVRWVFADRESQPLHESKEVLSTFGTADESFVLPADVPLGSYAVQVHTKSAGEWRTIARAVYEVAEYRPPEFLVDVNADAAPRFAGDTLVVNVAARYLFGAPMANAPLRWVVQQRALNSWDLEIPNTDEWQIGSSGWDDDAGYSPREVQVAREGVDTLDARGARNLKIALPEPPGGRGARTSIYAVVTDANRQTVTAARTVLVHPAAFYIGVKTRGERYFWTAGTPVTLDVIAVRPTGERVSGVAVQGAVVRREWHRARRARGGEWEEVGGWVSDTVARCAVRTAAEPVSCEFTPAAGGSYIVALTARDAAGRTARTTMWRWAEGGDWVPWRDESELKMEVIADKQRYSVGDTATVLIASPFTDVEAWVTIERERVIESRRMRIKAGATSIRVPITEALVPNAFVSVVVVRGRTAPPGTRDDPGRPALRVGYAELRVVSAVKKLDVTVAPLQAEYRPGDTARVRIAVKDFAQRGQRSEVTLWAVDEGVLALTGYRTPDPVELIYRPRGLGVRLASNLVAVAAQLPPGPKAQRAPGGGGGADLSLILRSRFQTTAFFLGSVVTDANGDATASAKLPDNLTTFRIMAVAVTAGDRYGSATSSMLVTRPLLARPSLPRFVREGDRFVAGVVVNQRMQGATSVSVEASARGIALTGAKQKTTMLSGAAGREVRFDFVAQPGDSAHFQFVARGGDEADAVAVRVPVRASYHPLAKTVAGALRDTATAEFVFDGDVDAARTRLEISFGSSPLAVIRGAQRSLRVYPYYCSEQISSTALPLIALYRAQKQMGAAVRLPSSAEHDINAAIRTLSRRQLPDGGISYWGAYDWSTPWLTAYAARVLLEAKAAGFAVDQNVLVRIGDYLGRALQDTTRARFAISHWYDELPVVLSERVAAVDLLSRLGRPDVPTENTLLGRVAQLRWEDRVLLAEVLARRGASVPARALLDAAWREAQVEGRRVTLPDNARRRWHYFHSTARPIARLLTATLALDPEHQLLGPLAETLVQHGRVQASNIWNTQDYGWTVLALMAYERTRAQAQGTVQIRGPKGTLVAQNLASTALRDTSFALSAVMSGNALRLPLQLTATNTSGPLYYFLTVREVPRTRPVKPVDNGIQVERWYERTDTRAPITSIAEGELVRVRVRITIPAERHFVVLDDPLPAGLEAVDLSLRTVSPFGAWDAPQEMRDPEQQRSSWYFGSWDSGVWSAFDHKELRDDRVVYFATVLWKGTYTASYLARATTAGTFAMPPAHAEEMYNPAVNGRTGGGVFTVQVRP